MSRMEPGDAPFPIDAGKRKLSTGAKIGIGCTAVILILILVCAGTFFFGLRWGLAKLDDFAQPYEQRGYARVSTQIVQVTTPITQPTVYTAQVANFNADVNADIAMMVQTADIRGNVNGDIDFKGQILTIHPGAVVTGDVRCHGAQVIRVLGVVEGVVSGDYGRLDDQSPQTTETDKGAVTDTDTNTDTGTDTDTDRETGGADP